MPPHLSTSLFGTLGAYLLYRVLKIVYGELTSPLRYLPGPKSAHWFYGNMMEFLADEGAGLEERWVQKYGRTMKVHMFFNQAQLHTTDAAAIHHFLSNTHIYQKAEATRFTLSRIVGPGVLVVEGDIHKQQRKIMNPAFGAPQVRELTSIFVDKSIQLRDIWAAQATADGGVARVEILSWLSKATLDIIGLAGFNYDINALGAKDDDAPDELMEAFDDAAKASGVLGIMGFLQLRFRTLRSIPTKTGNIVNKFQAVMARIGRQLLAESKRDIVENGAFETGRGRDLLSLLVRANMSKEIPASQQLSDEDVIAQVPTFWFDSFSSLFRAALIAVKVAGHETTSTAVTWALFALTQHMAVQTRLRDELLGVSTDSPTMDELDALPYLDCVVRETLRLYAPVPATSRIALQEDVVPLSTPVTDTRGTVNSSLRILKGQLILIPILAMNRDFKIWGPNAMEFVPERWESLPSNSANGIPGVWGHMLTFLGGPRSCIGFRFSLAETKALLFTLVRAFEFELAVPSEDIGRKDNAIVRRPVVLTDLAAGGQLPLLVRSVVR